MSKTLWVAAFAALWMGSVASAVEPPAGYNGAFVRGGALREIRPSGLRFGDTYSTVQTVRTGSVEGADGDVAPAPQPIDAAAPANGGPYGPCNDCGPFCGPFGCADWKLLPWYGSWEDHHHHHGAGYGCRNGRCARCLPCN